MEPGAPAGIPHRMPAASTDEEEQEMGDPEANKLYETALVAREATEILVEALDDPTYDSPYESAFKASACLRRVLNDLERLGAHPVPSQRVVAPSVNQQKYAGFGSSYAGYSAGAWGGGDGGLEEMKLEVPGMDPRGLGGQAVELYNKMDDDERRAFQAFILGDASGDKQ